MIAPTYEELIASGQSVNMALILSCRKAPGVHGTDTTAFAGFGSLKKQLGRDFDRVTKVARNHGYSPGSHDVYNPTFARFEGDPRAFSSQAQGLGHFKKLAENNGQGMSGDSSVKAREVAPPPKRKKLAPDLVARHFNRMAAQNPDILRKDRREVVEGIIDKHAL